MNHASGSQVRNHRGVQPGLGADGLPVVLPHGGGRQAPDAGKTLVVAARALAPGTLVAAESVKTMRVPESLFPKGGYSHVEDVVGRPVISSIQPDEAVVEARLAARGSGFGVAPHDSRRHARHVGAGQRRGGCGGFRAAGNAGGRAGHR